MKAAQSSNDDTIPRAASNGTDNGTARINQNGAPKDPSATVSAQAIKPRRTDRNTAPAPRDPRARLRHATRSPLKKTTARATARAPLSPQVPQRGKRIGNRQVDPVLAQYSVAKKLQKPKAPSMAPWISTSATSSSGKSIPGGAKKVVFKHKTQGHQG